MGDELDYLREEVEKVAEKMANTVENFRSEFLAKIKGAQDSLVLEEIRKINHRITSMEAQLAEKDTIDHRITAIEAQLAEKDASEEGED